MKRRMATLILVIVLILCGCSDMFNGYYYSEKPHLLNDTVPEPSYTVGSIPDICSALGNAIANAQPHLTLVADGLDQMALEEMLRQAYLITLERDPLAAYAVDGMSSRLGQVDGKNVAVVSLEYLYGVKQLRSIPRVQTMEDAAEQIRDALDRCDGGLVLYVQQYEQRDVAQIVEEHAFRYPDRVMEVPRVLTGVYPNTGDARVVEIAFSYTTDRGSLKWSQELVDRRFDEVMEAAAQDVPDGEKYQLLWSSLMACGSGRYDTSITPAFSLLLQGVGDSKAYAQVYAAMCERMGLECQVVRGTKDGQAHCWVVIPMEEGLRHLDLLSGEFQPCTDDRMEGFVWDPSVVPACPADVA